MILPKCSLKIHHLSPFWDLNGPYLFKVESSSHKDALCQIWLKLVQWLWSRRLLNFISVFSQYRYFLPLKMSWPLNKFESSSRSCCVDLASLKIVAAFKLLPSALTFRWLWNKRNQETKIIADNFINMKRIPFIYNNNKYKRLHLRIKS